MKELFYDIDILYEILVSPNYWKFTEMHFNGFIASSACGHKNMEHADDVSKFLGWNCVTLLAIIQKVLYQLKNLSEEVTYNVTTVTHKYLENTFWQKA